MSQTIYETSSITCKMLQGSPTLRALNTSCTEYAKATTKQARIDAIKKVFSSLNNCLNAGYSTNSKKGKAYERSCINIAMPTIISALNNSDIKKRDIPQTIFNQIDKSQIKHKCPFIRFVKIVFLNQTKSSQTAEM